MICLNNNILSVETTQFQLTWNYRLINPKKYVAGNFLTFKTLFEVYKSGLIVKGCFNFNTIGGFLNDIRGPRASKSPEVLRIVNILNVFPSNHKH